ncbi:hypothetical protein [Streptomyces mangrovisoli]|uniref:Uncharacterized protein n=1 Tax=Streptomyces mangrovisoli TaxID=1428628 RepID=A0A1J4NZB4_9ACTN|nr:hypothetical protein [Streptomyces mangrovisoli]OIJ66518.1 hypothetical protein WN71_017630 [Streptomyces mangrovisoli]
MTVVVDSDELVRRMQRARARALAERQVWRTRREEAQAADPAAAREAEIRTVAYDSVLVILDEILTPGSSAPGN